MSRRFRFPMPVTGPVRERSLPRRRGFLRRSGLLLPAVLAPMAEVAVVRTLGPPGSAALGPQVTAPPPLDLFHDLRWISVFHDSWFVLALELLAVVVLRSLWVAWMVQRAWPAEGSPAMHASVRRVAVFYAVAIVLLTPWVVLLFAGLHRVALLLPGHRRAWPSAAL